MNMFSWNDIKRESCKRLPGRCNECGLKIEKSVLISSNPSIETAERVIVVYCSNCGYYCKLGSSYVVI